MVIGIDASHANKIQRTGVEEYCFQIIQEFKKIIPDNIRVILYVQNELLPELSDLPTNWEVKILRWPLKKLWSQLCLAYELYKTPPDIYFSPGQLLPFFTPQNSVVTVHDSAFEAYPGAYRFWGRLYLKWMNRVIVKKAKLIFTSTEFNKSELLKFYGHLFVDRTNLENKIKIAPLAYDNKKYNLEVQNAENFYGEYILSIGRLEEKKNTWRLVKAFDLLKKDFPNLKLVLIGASGAGFDKVQQAIDGSPNRQDIILPGFVQASDISSILKQARVFMFPSLYEGFGIPVLEALAMGVPVVVSDIPAIREIAGPAVEFVYPLDVAEIAQKTSLLLQDQTYRDKKIALGIVKAKEFSWTSTAKRTYDYLLSGKNAV